MPKTVDEDQSEADPDMFIDISGHKVVKGPKPFSNHIDKTNDEKEE